MENISWNGCGFMESLQHCNHFVQMHEWFMFCHMLADKFIGQLARSCTSKQWSFYLSFVDGYIQKTSVEELKPEMSNVDSILRNSVVTVHEDIIFSHRYFSCCVEFGIQSIRKSF